MHGAAPQGAVDGLSHHNWKSTESQGCPEQAPRVRRMRRLIYALDFLSAPLLLRAFREMAPLSRGQFFGRLHARRAHLAEATAGPIKLPGLSKSGAPRSKNQSSQT
jgi:hypothetical protein